VATGYATSIDDNHTLGALLCKEAERNNGYSWNLERELQSVATTKNDLVLRSLQLVCRIQYCQDVFDFEGSVSRAMIKVQNAVPFILHLHKRIIEKIMSLVYALCLNEHSKDNKQQRLEYAKNMSDFLNENAFGSPDKPGFYHVPMDQKTVYLGEVKFNDGVPKKLGLILV
jgi:hypothetical protein